MSLSAIKSHPLGTVLSQLSELNSKGKFADPDGNLSSEQVWMIDRIFAVANRTQQLLLDTPASLISLAGIANLHSHFSNVLSEMQAFANSRDFTHVNNANNSIDGSIMPSMWAFSPTRDRAGQALGKSFSQIAAKATDEVDVLRERGKQVASKLEELSSSTEKSLQKLQELSESIEVQRKQNAEIIDEFRSSYAELERNLGQKVEAERSEIFVSYQEAMQKQNETNADFSRENQKRAADLVSEIEKHEKDARRILQIVGNIGVTGNYKGIADSEAESAKTWRMATIGFFTVGILIALSSFGVHLYQGIIGSTTPESFWTFAMRFVTAVAISSPAIYTARESARHRTNSDRARQKELELASLGPFMDSLPDDMKITLREKLTEKYFGKDIEAHEIKNAFEPNDLSKSIEALATLVAKVRA